MLVLLDDLENSVADACHVFDENAIVELLERKNS
jgi:hypothetical protein